MGSIGLRSAATAPPALAAVIASAALALAPPTATAAVLPPGNSAANQYTEAYPTDGGNSPAADRGHRTPTQALGKKNAKRLEAQGPEGRAAAEIAAATAPVAQPPGGSGSAGNRSSSQPAGAGGADTQAASATGAQPRGGGDGAGQSGGSGGSSGFDRVLGQATGSSSSGQLGPFLPLLIAAAVVWSIAYTLRRRRRAGQ